MGTIGTVLTPQMPKQVWQADDGRVFSTEQECVTYEGANKVMRLLYEESGDKRHWDDIEQVGRRRGPDQGPDADHRKHQKNKSKI